MQLSGLEQFLLGYRNLFENLSLLVEIASNIDKFPSISDIKRYIQNVCINVPMIDLKPFSLVPYRSYDFEIVWKHYDLWSCL